MAIASAIASERPVILFDEPTSGLDLFHMRQVADSVKGLADSGKTIVIVTHDDLITANLQEHYTMDELAERFQISLTGMKTCFKEIYGDSMYSYLRRYRMNVAATMLRQDSKKGIAEIAGAVGYESPSKFATAFRQVIGQTPMEYRKSFF